MSGKRLHVRDIMHLTGYDPDRAVSEDFEKLTHKTNECALRLVAELIVENAKYAERLSELVDEASARHG